VGSIDPAIGNSQLLINLYLNSNELDGILPIEINMLSQLARMDVSNNSIKGTLPSMGWVALMHAMPVLTAVWGLESPFHYLILSWAVLPR
jgi:hypothetical protein